MTEPRQPYRMIRACVIKGCDERGLAPYDLCAFHAAAVEVDGKTYADGHEPTITCGDGECGLPYMPPDMPEVRIELGGDE